jgi:predicted  nucleic acid-binding Zn-ribbon protein
MADYSELKRKAQEIRDEVKAGANTASRVGLALEDTVKALEAENQRAEQVEVSLENSIQLLQDEIEDLPSIRDNVAALTPKVISPHEQEAMKKDGTWEEFLEINPIVYVTEG